MLVIEETEARTTVTTSGDAVGLAAPSQGSQELSTWRLRMKPDAQGPVHTINREQIFMPLSGTFDLTVDGECVSAGAGQAVVLPADSVRQIRCAGEPAEAIVCMANGGTANIPGTPDRVPLPWAQ